MMKILIRVALLSGTFYIAFNSSFFMMNKNPIQVTCGNSKGAITFNETVYSKIFTYEDLDGADVALCLIQRVGNETN